MISRVATFALNQSMIDAALRTQAKIADLQVQSASGKRSSDFGGLGTDSEEVLDIQVAISQSKTMEDGLTSADGRIQAMYSAVGSITDILTEFKSSLTSAISTDSDSDTLKELASGYMSDIAAQLNANYQGRYLFSGTNTDVAPVDLDSYANPTSSTITDVSYYTGTDDKLSVRASGTQLIQYGVTADESAFEKALRALSMIANSSSTTISSSDLSAALDLATEALDESTAVQSGLSLSSQRIEQAITDQQNVQDFLSGQESNLTDVDVATITVQLSSYQAQLEASYAAMSKILSLRLTDYLK